MAEKEATEARRETVKGDRHEYTAVFERAEEGGYTVTVPALPGLVTEGDTYEQAYSMVEDAIRGYLESLQKDDEEIPVEREAPITQRVAVTLSRA